jgi:hypothetical protein
MQPAAPPPPPATAAPRRAISPKLVLITLLLLGAAFLAGYVPQRLRADRLEETLRTTTLDLELANIHRDLGNAALEAQRHNFANAQSAAAAFFDGCSRLVQTETFPNEPRTRVALGAYAGERDQLSVQLATGDPQAAQKLASLYFTMNGVLARRR